MATNLLLFLAIILLFITNKIPVAQLAGWFAVLFSLNVLWFGQLKPADVNFHLGDITIINLNQQSFLFSVPYIFSNNGAKGIYYDDFVLKIITPDNKTFFYPATIQFNAYQLMLNKIDKKTDMHAYEGTFQGIYISPRQQTTGSISFSPFDLNAMNNIELKIGEYKLIFFIKEKKSNDYIMISERELNIGTNQISDLMRGTAIIALISAKDVARKKLVEIPK